MKNLSKARGLIQQVGRSCCSAAILTVLINMVAELPAQQFSYVVTNGAITITRGCQAGAVEVPNQINGLPVTSIGNVLSAVWLAEVC